MKWLSRLLVSRSDTGSLDAGLRETLDAWHKLPASDLNRSHFETRYVVVNTEASGTQAGQDRLLAVSAIALEGGVLSPQESFYASLEPDPATALTNLLVFVGNDPVAVFNSAFNRTMLEHGFDHFLGVDPHWEWLDLYWVLGSLFPEHELRQGRLAEWMARFGIETFQRHHALGDAYVITQLLMATLARSMSRGMVTPRALTDYEQRVKRDGGIH